MTGGIKLVTNFLTEPYVCATHECDHYVVYKFSSDAAAKGAWVKAMHHKPYPYASAFIIKGRIQAYFVNASFDKAFLKGLVMDYGYIPSGDCHVTHE